MNNYVQAQIISRRFQQLGFSQAEITEFLRMLCVNAAFTVGRLQTYGYSLKQAGRLKYMFDIYSGKTQIETQDELARHLRKMADGSYKISIQDFPKSRITNIPRVAVIANIKQPPYDIWNSRNYKGKEVLYKVVDVCGQRITVETSRKPDLPNRHSKRTHDIFEIKGVKANGNILVNFNKRYCMLCNRFAVVCSFRNLESHLGKYEMVCFEGTKIYVYAINIGTKEAVHLNSENHIVYDCGILADDVDRKLKKVAQLMYNHLKCVAVKYCEPNRSYSVADCAKKE